MPAPVESPAEARNQAKQNLRLRSPDLHRLLRSRIEPVFEHNAQVRRNAAAVVGGRHFIRQLRGRDTKDRRLDLRPSGGSCDQVAACVGSDRQFAPQHPHPQFIRREEPQGRNGKPGGPIHRIQRLRQVCEGRKTRQLVEKA